MFDLHFAGVSISKMADLNQILRIQESARIFRTEREAEIARVELELSQSPKADLNSEVQEKLQVLVNVNVLSFRTVIIFS